MGKTLVVRIKKLLRGSVQEKNIAYRMRRFGVLTLLSPPSFCSVRLYLEKDKINAWEVRVSASTVEPLQYHIISVSHFLAIEAIALLLKPKYQPVIEACIHRLE